MNHSHITNEIERRSHASLDGSFEFYKFRVFYNEKANKARQAFCTYFQNNLKFSLTF